MLFIRSERPGDVPAREALLDRAFGPCRFTKSSEGLRAGNRPADGLALVATAFGRLVGTVRLWPVTAGGRPALLLGPLAVDPEHQGGGVGAALMRRALATARRRGHTAVILVGDPPYYARFGFSATDTAALTMPGTYDQHRLLSLDLVPGALAGAAGTMAPAVPGPATLGALRLREHRQAAQSGGMMPRAA